MKLFAKSILFFITLSLVSCSGSDTLSKSFTELLQARNEASKNKVYKQAEKKYFENISTKKVDIVESPLIFVKKVIGVNADYLVKLSNFLNKLVSRTITYSQGVFKPNTSNCAAAQKLVLQKLVTLHTNEKTLDKFESTYVHYRLAQLCKMKKTTGCE